MEKQRSTFSRHLCITTITIPTTTTIDWYKSPAESWGEKGKEGDMEQLAPATQTPYKGVNGYNYT